MKRILNVCFLLNFNFKKSIPLFCPFMLFQLSVSLQAQIIRYVKPTGTGTADGSSWANASGNLQSMINMSAYGNQVWVAKGTYQPALDSSFHMLPYVAIYGGFSGTETVLSARNYAADTTILKGNGSSVIFNNNTGLTATAQLDGFTIEGGTGYADGNGGGIYNAGSPTISNCTISGNSASGFGGGIYNNACSPTIINCNISGNRVGVSGAGVFNQISSSSIINCTFSGNYSGVDGGGISNYESSPNISNCIMWGDAGGEIFNVPGSIPSTQFSDVQGGYSGNGNINVNPLFVTQVDSSTAPFTGGNYQLQFSSPCINAGSNSLYLGYIKTDLELADNPRLVGDSIDMGAYEKAKPLPPICNIDSITFIHNFHANVSYTFSSVSNLIAVGVCWSTNPNPVIGVNNFTNSDSGTSGSHTDSLKNLNSNTTYHVRAYATYRYGTVYSNDTTFTTTKCENALNFDGIKDLVALPALGTNLHAITIETWFLADSFSSTGFNGIFNTNTWNPGNAHFQFAQGNLQFAVNGASVYPNLNYTFALNKWYHIAVSYNSDSSKIKFYVNGSLIQTNSLTTAPRVNLTVAQMGAWNKSRYYNGDFDEYQIWGMERTDSDIVNDLKGNLIGTESSLLIYYKFNEGEAGMNNAGVTTLYDKSINAQNGILNNFTLLGDTSNWIASTIPQLILSADTLYLGSWKGSSSDVILTDSSNISWSVSSNQTWLTVTQGTFTGGNTLIISTNEADTGASRTALLTLNAAALSQTITVIQAAGITYWTGKESDMWEDPANWSTNSVPTDGVVVYVNAVTTFSPVIRSQAICKTIYLNNSANLTVASGFSLTVRLNKN